MASVLVIGSGGREHALSWKLAQNPKVSRVFVAPGNAGCEQGKVSVVAKKDLDTDDVKSLVNYCTAQQVSLIVVGPEVPLANGLVDKINAACPSIACFGPTQAAAMLETSKAFSKNFMHQHNLPTARYETFTDAEKACQHIKNAPYEALVVKASGLAAGKGVIVASSREEACEAAADMLTNKTFGSASEEIVVEELLSGEEVSALCFSDGHVIRSMPIAQDHKRLLEDDQGPNTGGMGVLYAGFMLTSDGPKLLEFNCRFGDPETQAIMPLLKSNLYDICVACANGTLAETPIEWHSDRTACGVVLVSEGYPSDYAKGKVITEISPPTDHAIVFHAGTASVNNQLVTNGGRVLCVTAVGSNLSAAREGALRIAGQISFEGKYFRGDIGRQVANKAQSALKGVTYAQSGVDIIEGDRLVQRIKHMCKETQKTRSGAEKDIGGFGAVFDLAAAGFTDPLLVLGTDGVGTKLAVADAVGRFDTVGIDLVAMCANDVLCQGGEPIAFLDYYVTGRLVADHAAKVIEGIAAGCIESGCALVGGETAEMPDVYKRHQWDVAGFVVGARNRDWPSLPRSNEIRHGDVVLGIASSGLHSNGFSLVRKIITNRGLNFDDTAPWDSSKPIGDSLLTPTKIYVKSLLNMIKKGEIKALAHITGGGLTENIPRVLPSHCAVRLDAASWQIHEVFKWLHAAGPVAATEMIRTFNCGIGMVAIVAESEAQAVCKKIADSGEQVFQIGRVVDRNTDGPSVQVDNLSSALSGKYSATNGHNSTASAKTKVGILISGSGTNMKALIERTLQADSNCEVALVISNKANAGGLKIARENYQIETKVIECVGKTNAEREVYEQKIDDALRAAGVTLICLAGFMRILTASFVNKWRGRLLNTHPSLLPTFKGHDAVRQALAARVRFTGCTVHFVEAEVDSGAIIEQAPVRVEPHDTEESLQERIKLQEHIIFPQAMEAVASKRVHYHELNGGVRANGHC
uniref:Trifunctional purine biosynthetic protein adenosine-3 n=1 Tax=Plectus sambesii TaxID=2011161 RepID=A0A914X1W8_9BILA